MQVLASLFIFILLITIALLLGAAVVPAYQLMWGWFVTPTFGIAVPSFGLMWGLAMFLGMLHHHHTDRSTEESLKVAFFMVIGIWLMTGCAKIVHYLFV